MQINKDNINRNNKGVDHDYKARDKVMLGNHAAYKYETPYNGPFVITWCYINGPVTLKCGARKIRYTIRHIKPHTSDTNVEDMNLKSTA